MSTSDQKPSDAAYISGEYTSRRGGGILYTYAGSWWDENYTIIWQVSVWEEGVLKGERDGRILSPPKDHVRAVVKGMIEKSIESDAAIGQ